MVGCDPLFHPSPRVHGNGICQLKCSSELGTLIPILRRLMNLFKNNEISSEKIIASLYLSFSISFSRCQPISLLSLDAFKLFFYISPNGVFPTIFTLFLSFSFFLLLDSVYLSFCISYYFSLSATLSFVFYQPFVHFFSSSYLYSISLSLSLSLSIYLSTYLSFINNVFFPVSLLLAHF
jgi:hypothetical protein